MRINHLGFSRRQRQRNASVLHGNSGDRYDGCLPRNLEVSAPALRRRGAFTLVEMLLVLVILAVLAAIVIPKFSGRSQQAKVTAAHSQISSIELALDAF